MYVPLPKMVLHLASRATQLGDMAEALYGAIGEVGLRLPARRDIARHAHVSEATVSRRLRASGNGEEQLAVMLATARGRTYPPGWDDEGWARWIPRDELELQDVRAWLACLALAPHTASVAAAVLVSWQHEVATVVQQLTGRVSAPGEGDPEVLHDAEAVQALLLGLSMRRLLDPGLTPDHALELLRRVISAMGHDDGFPAPE